MAKPSKFKDTKKKYGKDLLKKHGKLTKSNPKFKSKSKGGFINKDGKKNKFSGRKKFVKKKEENKENNRRKDMKFKTTFDEEKKHEKTTKRKLPSNKNDENEVKKEKKIKNEAVSKLMLIYETLRRKKTSAEEKKNLIDEVYKIACQKQNEIIYKHDTVRVIEMCVKFGDEKQRNDFFKLFKDNTILLATSKYGKFLVEKLLEYGSKTQKKDIIESFYGKIKKLIKHKGASSIIDEVYDKHANASQRSAMVEEFYGPEFAVFKIASGRTLEEILENDPSKKEIILKYMKDTLSVLCQKEVIRHSILHRALYDYFKYADTAQKTSLVEVLRDGVIHILHTKEGARVAMNCLWHATTKERKSIIKSFKTYVTKICKEEYGHLVLLALFDVIDDTVLVKKVIFSEILSNLQEIMVDQYGRKVCLYLLKPRSKSYFLPDIVQLLEKGDGNPHSKKEQPVRQEELRQAILPELLKAMEPHLKDILENKSASILLLAALEVASESQSSNLMERIIELVKKPMKFLNEESGELENEQVKLDHPISHPCGHWVIKNIITQDKQRLEKGFTLLFSKMLCDVLPTGSLEDWASTNRGSFVLVSLLETGIDSITKRVKSDLNSYTKNKTVNPSKGMEILLKLLAT